MCDFTTHVSVLAEANFKNNASLDKARKYFTEKMLSEKEHWVGFYANKLIHLGNRTSNRAETTHSAIKTGIENVSSGNMLTVTDKIDTWYRKM
ncbi:hypothetical protein INT48_003049, partial [Thamnidium elegans]